MSKYTGPSENHNLAAGVSSQQVCWWSFRQWYQQWTGPHLDAPMAGTPAWSDLDDTDHRKWAAVLSAAEHHVLRVETAQDAQAQASQAISGAADWTHIATQVRNHAEFLRDHPWARRVS